MCGRGFSNKKSLRKGVISISEFGVLLIIIFSGVFVGFCFDFYRIVRWRMGFSKVLTFIGDLFFSIISLLVIYYCAQMANYLELRFYLFLGSLVGLLFYLRFLSKSSKRLFDMILRTVLYIKAIVIKLIMNTFKTTIEVLTILMSVPYGILNWFALLLFRFGEALGKESVTKVRGRITKTPRQ